MRMEFNVVIPAGGVAVNYIDLSQCASLLNRRFYRQGLDWAVAGFKFLAFSGPGIQPQCSIGVDKLPQTWIMSNAWEKGFRAWQKMNNEALQESESIRPKFLDFKIYADSTHHAAGFGANLLPNDGAGNGATAGEWESSKYRVPDTASGAGGTQNREVIAVGPSYPGAGASGFNAVSLISGYATSRALPNVLDPNVPADAADVDGAFPDNWISALFNEGTQQTEDVIEDMITENVIAPYPFENDGVNLDTMYPGGETQLPALMQHDLDFITGTTIGGTVRMPGGTFPCGLIQLGIGNRDLENQVVVTCFVDLIPGTHRGYLATPMTEM